MKINGFNYGSNSRRQKTNITLGKQKKGINKNKNRNQYIWKKCEIDKFTKSLFQKDQ